MRSLLAHAEELGDLNDADELGAGSRSSPSGTFADPIGPLEVGEHQDVEQLGAGSGAEGFLPIAQDSLDVLQVHGWDASTGYV